MKPRVIHIIQVTHHFAKYGAPLKPDLEICAFETNFSKESKWKLDLQIHVQDRSELLTHKATAPRGHRVTPPRHLNLKP